jgi:acyl carrier protein
VPVLPTTGRSRSARIRAGPRRREPQEHTTSSTDAVLFDVLTTKFNVPEREITPGSTMDDLDTDSLALAEPALALQDRVGVRIEGHEADEDTTVAELTATLAAKRATTSAR